MFIIGNADLLEREKNGIWPSVIKDLRAHGWVGSGFPLKCKNHPEQIRIVESAEQLKNGVFDNRCALKCARSMPCGHVCQRRCM